MVESVYCSGVYSFGQLGIEDIDNVLVLEKSIFTTPWSKEQYSTLMKSGICKIFGVYKNTSEKKLVAYISLSNNVFASELEVYNIAVVPQERRQGLAKKLMELALDAARQLNLERVILEVRESNHVARALYKKLGFVECGKRTSYYSAPNEDAILYVVNF